MSLIPVGKQKEMKQQQVRPSYTTDLSALLKFAQSMPPKPPSVSQESVDLGGGQDAGQAGMGGDEGGAGSPLGDPAGQAVPNQIGGGDNKPVDFTNSGDPANPLNVQKAPQMQDSASVPNVDLASVEKEMAAILHRPFMDQALDQKATKMLPDPQNGTVRYNISMKQWVIDRKFYVYDMSPVVNDIKQLMAKYRGKGELPIISSNRQPPDGLIDPQKYPNWTFWVSFGGEQKGGQAETSPQVDQAPQGARRVGRLDPRRMEMEKKQQGGSGGSSEGQSVAAASAKTMREVFSARKDSLVKTLRQIAAGQEGVK